MLATGIIFIVVTAVFVGFGFVFGADKGSSLLSGYNAMDAAEKSNYDEKTLLRNTAKAMFLLAALHGLTGILFIFSLWIVALIVLFLGYVILFATGQFATGNNSKSDKRGGSV
jgi:hypothetical protein